MIETRFSYEIKFNGSDIDVTQGTVLVEKLQEPLDEGAINVPITVKDIEYEMFGFLQIKIIGLTSSKDFTFFIQEDEVVTATKDGIYTHQLTLIEYTYAYDTKLVKALTFTQNLQNNRKATFFVNLPSTTSNYNYAIKDYWLPPIDLKEMNVTNKELVVPECEQAYQNDGGSGYFRRDVFIRIYTPNNVVYNVSQRRYVPNGAYDKETILSNEDFTFTATQEGVHLIEYGIVNLFDGEKAVPRAVVFTFTLNFFNEQIYTLYDYVERIKRVVPLESKMYHGQTRLFNLDPSLVERFKQIKMPQIFITQMTLRQTLNTLFKFINAILKLEYVEDGLDNLTIHEFNKVIGSFDLEKMVDFKTSQNIQGYGTTITSWLESAMQTNFRETPTVKTPANNYYKTVRAKNVQLTENQNGFILPLDGGTIYEINKLSVVIPKITYGGYSSGSATPLTVKTFYEIDLTDRTLPIDAWEIKNITNDFPAYEVQPMFSQRVGMRENKGGNIYYERGKDYIDFSKEFGAWFSEVLIMQVLKEALAEYFTINNPLAFLNYGPIDERTGFVVDNIDQNWFYRNIGFNVEYTTLKSVTVKNHRNDISNIYKNTEIRLNQNARITDFNLATRNAVGYLERMGVPNKDFSRVHTSLDDLLKIGMQDKDGYVITKATYELNNDYIVGNYEATKDHIRLSEFMGIDRAFRAFAVPNNSQVYDRDEQYEDFIMVAPIDSNLIAETTMFNNQFINKCFKTITSNEKLQNKISFAFVRTDGFSKIYRDEVNMYKAIMTPVSSYGGEQVLLFTFGFKSNLVAGDAIYKKGPNYFNDAIRYTDQLGRFEELWFAMADYYTETTPFDPIGSSGETTFNKTYSYPLVQSPNNRFNQNFLISTGDIDNSTYNPIIFSKDPSEVLRSMNYQVNILSLNYTQYIIGSKFFTDNRLVLNNEDVEKLYLYKYKDGTRYDVFETLLAKIDSNLYDYDVVELDRSLAFNNIIYLEYANGTSVVRFTNNAIIRSEHTSWAIANEQGELYFACNENENGFRLVPRHFRPYIQDLKTMNDSNYVVELNDTLFISVQMNIEQFVFPQVTLSDTLALNVSFDIQTSTDNVLEINDGLQLSCGLIVTKFENPTLILNDNLSLASSLTIHKSTDFILPTLNDTLALGISFDIEKVTGFIVPTLNDTLELDTSFVVSKSTDFAVPTLNDTLSLNVSMTLQKEEKVWTYIGTSSATYDNTVDLYDPLGCPTQAQAKAFLDEEYPATNLSSGYIMRVARRGDSETLLCRPAYYYFRVDIITT